MYKKRALITGITGQDGAYLAKFLLDKGYNVFGIVRRISSPNYWRLQELGILDKVSLIGADLTDQGSMHEAIVRSSPDEIYNLAAQSFVGASFDQPIGSTMVNGLGLLKILEIVRNLNRNIRVYQASTSELYGSSGSEKYPSQDENTPFNPNSPYAIAKLFAFHTGRVYRESYGLFVTNGILFNHESEMRGMEFVTRKISNSVARIKLGLQKELKLGNLDSKRDWGYAPEYVECMWRMLQHSVPEDFVIATNETHSVREFVEEAFNVVGLNWQDYVKHNSEAHLRPFDVHYLKGDHGKAKKILGWEPKTKFKELVKIMVEADLNRWERLKNGELFAWDAPNHSEDLNFLVRPQDK